MNWLIVDEIIKNALKEDIPSEDITTTPLVTENSLCSVNLISKEDGILAGAEVFARVFALLGDVDVSFNKKDGDTLKKGEIMKKLSKFVKILDNVFFCLHLTKNHKLR